MGHKRFKCAIKTKTRLIKTLRRVFHAYFEIRLSATSEKSRSFSTFTVQSRYKVVRLWAGTMVILCKLLQILQFNAAQITES